MSVLTERIEAARREGRKALIPYLPCGFPDKERFWEEVAALDAAGADVIEIGVPFSDPVADGPVIEEAAQECLARGVTLKYIIKSLKERKGSIKAGLVLMGYANSFYRYGFERFARDAAEAGVHGLIVPDLPYEESAEFRGFLRENGLDLIPLVGLNTSVDRLSLYAKVASGFAYFVSVLGTTGARESLPEEVLERLGAARETFDVPLALGFGITRPEQVERFGDLIDAVVFGSALIKHIRSGGTSAGFMARFTRKE